MFLLFNFIFSQIITSDYVATYNLKYPIMGSKNEEQMILLINSKNQESVFMSSNKYVLDSIRKNKKTDVNTEINFDSAFNEILYKKNNKIKFLEEISGYNFFYEETPNIAWKITTEKKEFNTYTLRKATGNAFGRNWIAWYIDNDSSINSGPYKFFNLPGFVVNVYDEKKEFEYLLTQFKKKTMTYSIPIKKFKFLNKIEFNKTKKLIKTNPSNLGMELSAAENKEWTKKLIKNYNNQPKIELQP